MEKIIDFLKITKNKLVILYSHPTKTQITEVIFTLPKTFQKVQEFHLINEFCRGTVLYPLLNIEFRNVLTITFNKVEA